MEEKKREGNASGGEREGINAVVMELEVSQKGLMENRHAMSRRTVG